MNSRGTQASTTAKPEGAAIRIPESKPSTHERVPVENAVINLQGGLGNRATAGLLRNVSVLQTSLRIGPVNDRYEREANRMADRVMQGEPRSEDLSAALAPAASTAVQRMCTECEEELEEDEPLQRDTISDSGSVDASPALESRVSSFQGRGSPLSANQRGFFEPRFGHDLSGVRLHTGPAASDAARLARARAFTVGRNIAFGAGEYRPATRSGQRLLAHELTHVVQQTPLVARRKPLVQRQPAATEESAAVAQPQPETPGPEPEREPAGSAPQSDEPGRDRAQAPGLLLEDDAATTVPGQMKKSEFMAATRDAACRSADAAFAGTDNTTQGCPYIELALRFYERRSAERIEQDLMGYAPEAAGATNARDYIPFIAERVRQSAETFVETGEVTGLPGGLPSGIGLLGGAASLFGGLFFKARQGGPRGRPDPRAVQARLGTGRPLAGSVRSRMQSGFGRRFSGVRVHTGSTASSLSNRFNARAFTVGNHVAFGSGEYRPGTPVGDALVAHELAHVVQQQNASASVAPLQTGTTASGALEQDADRSAAGVVASLWNRTSGGVTAIGRSAVPRMRSGLTLQRCARTEPVTAVEADQFIRQQFGENVAETIAAGISAASSEINVVNDAEFRRQFEANNAHVTSIGGTPRGSDSSRVIAFVDRRPYPRPRVWVHSERRTTETLIHEALHLYSHESYGRQIPWWRPDEGITEYFTRKIADEQNIAIGDFYEDPYQEVLALVEVASESSLRRAYFEGNVDGLAAAVNGARTPGTFDEWLYQMILGSYERARSILEQGADNATSRRRPTEGPGLAALGGDQPGSHEDET